LFEREANKKNNIEEELRKRERENTCTNSNTKFRDEKEIVS
jgi:hypothetical protein